MSGNEIDEESLGRWLEAYVEGFNGPYELKKFPSGQSNPTYRVTAASGEYVLRRKPFGVLLPSAHAVDREYRLLSALAPLDFPVPQPLALCDDPDVIGAIFYVMELARGRSYNDGALPDFDPATRRLMYEQLIDTLADLHTIDPETAGLGDFGKAGNYFERQVMRWTRQYRDSQTDYVPEMERLIAFLPETIPEQSRMSVVHGDYRIDNVMFDGDGTLDRGAGLGACDTRGSASRFLLSCDAMGDARRRRSGSCRARSSKSWYSDIGRYCRALF